MGLLTEFKTFINKGNAIDLAVGVVIGAAFGKIVNSIVSDLVMPPIGLLIGGVNFTDIKFILKAATIDAAGVAIPEVALRVGSFIQILIEFIIIAFAIFMVVKGLNKMKKAEAEAPAAPPVPTNEEKLLGEIRDLLKK